MSRRATSASTTFGGNRVSQAELIGVGKIDDNLIERFFVRVRSGHRADHMNRITHGNRLEMMQLHGSKCFLRPRIRGRIKHVDRINAPTPDQIEFFFDATKVASCRAVGLPTTSMFSHSGITAA